MIKITIEGPTGAGKSIAQTIIKEALEEYLENNPSPFGQNAIAFVEVTNNSFSRVIKADELLNLDFLEI